MMKKFYLATSRGFPMIVTMKSWIKCTESTKKIIDVPVDGLELFSFLSGSFCVMMSVTVGYATAERNNTY